MSVCINGMHKPECHDSGRHREQKRPRSHKVNYVSESDKVIAWLNRSSSRLPADKTVDDIRQVAATFVPICNFWAFYGIRRLQKFLVYVVLPQAAILAVISWYGYKGAYSFMDINPLNPLVLQLAIVAAIAVHGFSIYLILKWSREHNRKYE